MADNLSARYANADINTIGPIRFVEVDGVWYAVSMLSKPDGTLIDLDLGAGAISANTLRVALASDDIIRAEGTVAHDAVATGVKPLILGGVSSPVAPATVSATGDAVQAWFLPNGSQVVTLQSNGLEISSGNGLYVAQQGAWTIGSVTSVGVVSSVFSVNTVSTVTNLAQMGGQAISMGSGLRSAGTQRVTIATDDLVPISASALPLPTGASSLAEQQTQTTHLTTLIGHVDGVESALTNVVTSLDVVDDWDESNRCKVNLIVGQAGITAGAGAVAVNTPRMTLASDDPLVTSMGDKADTTATTDGGTFSFIALFKRSLNYLSSILSFIETDIIGYLSSIYSATTSIDANTSQVATAIGTDLGTGTVKGIMINGYNDGFASPVAMRVDASGRLLAQLYSGSGTSIANGNGTNASALRVTVASDSTGVIAVTQSGTWDIGTVTTVTGGGVAHDSVDSGNPIKVGGKAASSLATATMVAGADRSDLTTDIDGTLLVRSGAPLGDNKSTYQSVTATTSTAATNFGAVASTKNVITEITIYNTSSTNTFVKIQDGNGGTTFWVAPAPANSGSVIQFSRGLKQPTANNALYFAANDAVTTLHISINGFQSKA